MNVSLFVRKSGNAFVALYIVLSQRRYACFYYDCQENYRQLPDTNQQQHPLVFGNLPDNVF